MAMIFYHGGPRTVWLTYGTHMQPAPRALSVASALHNNLLEMQVPPPDQLNQRPWQQGPEICIVSHSGAFDASRGMSSPSVGLLYPLGHCSMSSNESPPLPQTHSLSLLLASLFFIALDTQA